MKQTDIAENPNARELRKHLLKARQLMADSSGCWGLEWAPKQGLASTAKARTEQATLDRPNKANVGWLLFSNWQQKKASAKTKQHKG